MGNQEHRRDGVGGTLATGRGTPGQGIWEKDSRGAWYLHLREGRSGFPQGIRALGGSGR